LVCNTKVGALHEDGDGPVRITATALSQTSAVAHK